MSAPLLTEQDIRQPKEGDLAGRRTAAVQAKAAQLEAHRAAKQAAEPTRAARQEERVAIAEARDERQAERARIKLEERERADAEALRLQVEANTAGTAEEDARKVFRKEARKSSVSDEACRKAERDRRYASRKAKKR